MLTTNPFHSNPSDIDLAVECGDWLAFTPDDGNVTEDDLVALLEEQFHNRHIDKHCCVMMPSLMTLARKWNCPCVYLQGAVNRLRQDGYHFTQVDMWGAISA